MKKELKRAFTSSMFFLSFFVFFLTLQGYALPTFINNLVNEPLEIRESALTLTLGGIFFGGAILLQPFCSPMAHAISQVDDLRSGILRWSVLRSSVVNYVARKAIVTFLSASLAIGGAFAIHSLLWNVLALPYNPLAYPNHEVPFAEETLFYAWSHIAYALPIYLQIMLGLAFSAGVWSVTALAAAVWVPDKLLAVTIPACIYQLWSGGLSYYLFGVRLISPSTLFNDWQTPERVKQALIAYGVLLVISLAVYYAGVKRRACYA
jgi:hypothetical protein